jgi:hypothetical protein
MVLNTIINDYKNIEQLFLGWFKDREFDLNIFIPELDNEVDNDRDN